MVLADKAFSPMYDIATTIDDSVSGIEVDLSACFTVAEVQRPQLWRIEAQIHSHADLARRAIMMRLQHIAVLVYAKLRVGRIQIQTRHLFDAGAKELQKSFHQWIPISARGIGHLRIIHGQFADLGLQKRIAVRGQQ